MARMVAGVAQCSDATGGHAVPVVENKLRKNAVKHPVPTVDVKQKWPPALDE
ncbi:hypothetical protein [Paracidovorax sp. MALMAid1276]|uniref:hypothetical protein n=1 Tax=Paracidovorax sp. MALMAid1276 TaxID=3411631 RepID=UPI003B997A78